MGQDATLKRARIGKRSWLASSYAVARKAGVCAKPVRV